MYAYYRARLQDRPAESFFLVVMNFFLGLSIAAWTLLGLFLFPFAFVYLKIIEKKSTPWITRWCIWVYGRVWQFLIQGFVIFEPLQFDLSQFANPGIIVVNHRSFFDTYCMNMLPESNVCFAVRDWPFKIPVYNLFMEKARYMNIEKFSWDKSLARAEQTLANKGFVLFFPEGHRSHNRQMTRFYSGAFKMAVETNAPIIPVCLTGTQDLLPPGRHYMKPARIKMKVLDPVWPDEFSNQMKHQAMKKKVKSLMAKALVSMESPETDAPSGQG